MLGFVMPIEEGKKKAGLYERCVHKITEWTKPNLHRITEEFVDKSVETYAKDKPRLARMIEFEVRRRGDGAGLTQDVAEPLLWTSVKTVAAIGVAIVSESIKSTRLRSLRWIGEAAALGIILNNAVDLFRLIPRYRAGLQGSLEMAKDRWRSLEETGVDPFDNRQGREIHKAPPLQTPETTIIPAPTDTKKWVENIGKGEESAPTFPPP